MDYYGIESSLWLRSDKLITYCNIYESVGSLLKMYIFYMNSSRPSNPQQHDFLDNNVLKFKS